MTGEYILKAAVRVPCKLFTGKNHSVCLREMRRFTEQGFIATTGHRLRFVDRKEALAIAREAGQKIDKHPLMNQFCS